MSVASIRVATIALVTACAIQEEEDIATVEQAAGWNWDCEAWGCGGNSPIVDFDHGLHALPTSLASGSPPGFTVTKISKGIYNYNVTVWGAAVSAQSTNNGPTLIGDAINGLTWYLTHSSGAKYKIQIRTRSRTPFWAKPNGQLVMTWTYTIEWANDQTNAGTLWHNLCSSPDATDPDNLGMDPFKAVLFEGDVIDAATKQVTGIDYGWFNIGCARHALGKLHLTGHSQAAYNINPGFTTSVRQRTLMLKMITADYCGAGPAFTQAGENLQWADAQDLNNYDTAVTMEARWSTRENRATCLESPRLDSDPDIRQKIDTACIAAGKPVLPTCGNDNTHDFDLGDYIISGNY